MSGGDGEIDNEGPRDRTCPTIDHSIDVSVWIGCGHLGVHGLDSIMLCDMKIFSLFFFVILFYLIYFGELESAREEQGGTGTGLFLRRPVEWQVRR